MSEAPDRWAATLRKRVGDVSHDIKTPLNIAVLNLELLRISLAKDEHVETKRIDYCVSAEKELRRISSILDAFFGVIGIELGHPSRPVAETLRKVSAELGVALNVQQDASIPLSESNQEKLFGLIFQGAASALVSPVAELKSENGRGVLTFRGDVGEAVEIGKIFKFYYTDPSQNPRLELATARLVVEAFGGSLELEQSGDGVTLIVGLPGKES